LKLSQKLPIISSISKEKSRFQSFLPVIKGSGCKVVALCVDDDGIPATAEGRVAVAGHLIEALVSSGTKVQDIYVDVLAQAVSAESRAVITVLDTIRKVKAAYSEVNTVLGMSNVSFGLPNRRLLNQNFAAMCLEAGLDAAIADPLDRKLMANILAADVLLGRDKYGMSYSRAFRAGKLV
jgi:5-methyltetrahydrofolate--homocysteine methyltransferase